MQILLKYFPTITEKQKGQFLLLHELYTTWNERINVISRKDIEHLYERHVLHSLAIAAFFNFEKDSKILDVGTGGGFPGIPLAIMFPESHFTLVDSIGKKITVVNEVAKALNLSNVNAFQARAESISDRFNFVVSRAVTEFPVFTKWVKGKFLNGNSGTHVNGIIYLKGGDFSKETENIKSLITVYNISEKFKEEFFETKKIIFLPIR